MNENHTLEGLRLGASYRSRYDAKRISITDAAIASTLPQPPADISASRRAKIDAIEWGVMLNDQLGDCTIAGEWHIEQAWTTYHGAPHVQLDTAISGEYFGLTGGQDSGLALLDVLKPWSKRQQYGLAGYAEIPWTDNHLPYNRTRELLQLGVWLAGAAYIAVELPYALQRNPLDWTTVGTGADWRAGTWGGHCVPILYYQTPGRVLRSEIVTWGKRVTVSETFLRQYMVEAWMPVGREWANAKGNTPNGRPLAVIADLAQTIAAA